MKIGVISKLENAKEAKISPKGYEELEIDYNDIVFLSNNKKSRLIGFGKTVYRLTAESYKKIRKKVDKFSFKVILL